MIAELKVHNISLIPELTVSFGEHLSVLTGETGAGKSILLGALSLLLGERASVDIIRSQCDTASVEAMFHIELLPQIDALLETAGLPLCDENTLILKRTLSRNGRGKCFVNGGYTTLNVLQKIGEELVDLHGQHEHQSLLQRSRQRDLLDAWAGLMESRKQLAEVYGVLRTSREARKQLSLDEAERVRRLDLLQFQVDEIDAASIQPGELESVQEERSRLMHAERIITSVQSVLELLHRREGSAVRDGLAESADVLAGLTAFDASMGPLSDILRSAEAMTEDVVERLSDFADSFEVDPKRLAEVEERLDLLHKLQRKYGNSEEEILAFREKAAQEKTSLTHQDDELERLAKEQEKLADQLAQQAQQLSVARQKAAASLAGNLEQELKALGFNQAIFKIQVNPRKDPKGWITWDDNVYHCGPNGADDIDFLISPNPGEEPRPVAKIASGGELSRIMLAIKVIAASAASVPTMIFDEVDAGIGGATAEAVGKKLSELSKHHQVVVITHLPQIARFADQHFLIHKHVEHGKTSTFLSALDSEAQVKELARLMAGEQITDTALQHARELIEKK
jgi:DNA repair protein RecN (Recombination protein N)